MRYTIIINVLFVTFFSCHSKQNGSEATNAEVVKLDSLLGNNKGLNGLWQQYRKEGAKPNDTIPDLRCFIKISIDTFYYIVDKKIMYTDLLIKDSSYNYPVYSFKNRYQDELHLLTKDTSEVQLKKYANEGDYEYFKKVSNLEY